MADVLELYDELCTQMPGENEDLSSAAGPEASFIGGGLLTAAFKAWVWKKVRDLGCEQSDVLLEAIQKWILEQIKNPTLAAVLSEVAKAIVETVCPAA